MNPTQPTALPSPTGFNRRSFLQSLGMGAGAAVLPALLTTGASKAQADVTSDLAILQFALNFEYIEAEYYTRATTGLGIVDFGIPTGGIGTPGTATIKPNPVVPFVNPNVQQYALEIAEDERLHVNFVRNTIIQLGGTPIAFPAIDYTNGFNMLAINAGIAGSFDPFANQENFILGGFTFSDVTVTALKGAAGLISTALVKSGASGILGVEGYHDGLIRYNLYRMGAYTQQVSTQISNLRDTLDGTKDLDQPVVNSDGTVNITPTDANSIAIGRTMRQVLNIVYGQKNATSGLFFPNGVNA